MNQRILIKQLGFKSTMKLRDYTAFRMDEDRDDLSVFKGYLDIKTGDIVAIITLESPKLKRNKKCPTQPKKRGGGE